MRRTKTELHTHIICAALITLQVENVRIDRTHITTERGRDLHIADALADVRTVRVDPDLFHLPVA